MFPFIAGHRRKEIEFLSKRKYLDALCVYFWATTPVLMCLLTFGMSVLIGQTLDAASTFASVALLNMLIGPLNAFPWVLNGLVEAFVSLRRVQKLFDVNKFHSKCSLFCLIGNTFLSGTKFRLSLALFTVIQFKT